MLKDRILVWKVQEGSKNALREVYQKYKDDILTIARSLLNEPKEAEDVLSDVFISFARSARYLRFAQELKPYLLTLTINNISDRARKKMYEVVKFDRPVSIQTKQQTGEFTETGQEQQAIITDALANVVLQQRIVVCLHLQTGMNFEQIGRIADIPAQMAEARYEIGIEKLRESAARTISETNHYGQIEDEVRKLRWQTDEGLNKKILDLMIPIIESQSHLWAGWKYLAAMTAVAVSAAAIIIMAVIVIEIFRAQQLARQKETAIQIPPPTVVKETVTPVKNVKKGPDRPVLIIPPDVTPPKQQEQRQEDIVKQIVLLISSNNIDGLTELLSKTGPDGRLAAAIYLAKMSDKRALAILENLSTHIAANEPNNIFAVTGAVLKKKLETQADNIKPVEEKKSGYEFVVGGVLSGLVKDAETDRGVANVTVILHGPSNSQTVSDADGYYSFDKVEGAGKYEISVFSKHYLDCKDGKPIEEADLKKEENTVKDLKLFMPACIVKIQVVNEANEPVSGALVYEAGSVSYPEPNKAVYAAGTSEQTDKNGEVLLGCFESSENQREFMAKHDNYAPEKLAVVLNNPKLTPFYRIVLKKQSADSSEQ